MLIKKLSRIFNCSTIDRRINLVGYSNHELRFNRGANSQSVARRTLIKLNYSVTRSLSACKIMCNKKYVYLHVIPVIVLVLIQDSHCATQTLHDRSKSCPTEQNDKASGLIGQVTINSGARVDIKESSLNNTCKDEIEARSQQMSEREKDFDALDNQASSSLLKISHHAPQTTHKSSDQNSKLLAEHKEVVSSDVFRLKRNKFPQTTTSPERKNKLALFRNQPKKLTLNSLLPNRLKHQVATNETSKQSGIDTSKQQYKVGNRTTATPLSSGAMITEESFPISTEHLPSLFSDPYLSNGLPSQQMVPYPPGHHQNGHNMMFPLQHAHQPILPTPYHNQIQHQRPHQAMFNQYGHYMHSPHQSQMMSHPMGHLQAAHNRPQEANFAPNDQTAESYHKIHLNKVNPHSSYPTSETMPVILASSLPSNAGANDQGGYLNKTTANSIIQAAAQLTAAQLKQQQHQLQQQQQRQQQQINQQNPVNTVASVAASALGSAAAAALLTERAKSLISQLNQQPSIPNRNIQSNIRNNREISDTTNNELEFQKKLLVASSQNNGVNLMAGNNLGLANMIKSAAEAWATNNMPQPTLQHAPPHPHGQPFIMAAQSVANGAASTVAGATADTNPTIILEHDGPSITTLDFNGLGPRPMAGPVEDGEDDDDETTTAFYSDEESESEGSHEAKRVLRPRKFHTSHHHHHVNGHDHMINRQVSSHPNLSRPPQTLQHPNFEEHIHHSHQHKPHSLLRGSTSPNEFFEEQGVNDISNDFHNKQHQSTGDGGNNDIHHEFSLPPSHPQGTHSSSGRRPVGSGGGNNGGGSNSGAGGSGGKQDRYPDSINAIKEQRGVEESTGQPPSKSTARREELPTPQSASTDPIENLIKELQDLNRKRTKNDSSSLLSSGLSQSRGNDDPERTKGSMKSPSETDYEDIMGEDQQDQFDKDDESTRMLRKKLLARLRAKHDRKKNNDGTISTFNGDSIRIPLHALLMAALDRRTSPSESRSQSVARDELLLDDRNKEILLQGRRDFSEATASLGSLFDDNSLFDFANAERFSVHRQHESLKPTNLNNVSHESLTPAGMLLMENLSSFDELNQKSIPTSHHGNRTSSAARDNNNRQVQDQAMSAATRMPSLMIALSATEPPEFNRTTSTTSTSTTVSPHDNRRQRPLSFSRNHRNTSSTSSGKGRRAIRDDDGDFDVDRQVDEYADDKNDRSLEPSWMKSMSRPAQQNKNKKGSGVGVDFDDEFDEINRRTRSKIASNQQTRKSRPRKQNTEADYVANEQRFFDNLQRDTSANINDVDHTIKSIENSIPDTNPQANRARRGRAYRQKQQNEEDYEQSEDNDSKSADGDDNENGNDDAAEGSDDSSVRARSDRRDSHQPAESQQERDSAAWKAQAVDNEVQRIEEEAKLKKPQREEVSDDGYSSEDSRLIGDDDQHGKQQLNEASAIGPH